jgi:hypothetical protein
MLYIGLRDLDLRLKDGEEYKGTHPFIEHDHARYIKVCPGKTFATIQRVCIARVQF